MLPSMLMVQRLPILRRSTVQGNNGKGSVVFRGTGLYALHIKTWVTSKSRRNDMLILPGFAHRSFSYW